MRRLRSLPVVGLGVGLAWALAARAEDPWPVFAETGVIEIVTRDEGGELRETKVWIVVVDEAGWVRTNDSRWLANIRRGAPVTIRAKQVELPVRAEERSDPAEYDRVEAAFEAKYGWLQRLMSAFRTTRPTVLRLTPLRAEATSRDARAWAFAAAEPASAGAGRQGALAELLDP